MGQHLITAVLILTSASCTVAGNLLLKIGADRRGIGSVWPLTVVNGHVILAACVFACAFLFYAMLLKRLPLSLATAIMSLQFVLVVLAANVLLDESVGRVRWLGIALMAVGLAVLGVAPNAQPTEPHSARVLK